jgi:luciferase family oxidoreductase group 1
MPALQVYRERFQPSEQLERPYAMVGVNVIAAETDAEARRLFTSAQQQFLNLVRGRPSQLPPPVGSMDEVWGPAERAHVERMTRVSAVGSVGAVRERLAALLAETGADELMLTAHVYDHGARLRSFELAAHAMRQARPPARS